MSITATKSGIAIMKRHASNRNLTTYNTRKTTNLSKANQASKAKQTKQAKQTDESKKLNTKNSTKRRREASFGCVSGVQPNQASNQASKRTSKQPSKQARKQASKQASNNKQASKQAKHIAVRACVQATTRWAIALLKKGNPGEKGTISNALAFFFASPALHQILGHFLYFRIWGFRDMRK